MVCVPAGTSRENCPFSSVTTPLWVPFSSIEAPGKGSFSLSVTIPVRVCAKEKEGSNRRKK